MSEMSKCEGCGAPVPLLGAVDGVATCEHCGSQTRVAPPGTQAPPQMSQLPAPPESGEKSGGNFLAVAITSLVIAGIVVGLWWMVAYKAGKKTRPPAVVTWKTDAKRYRGQMGKSIPYNCPPGGKPHPVWGSNPYSDDSSVCTAAVHAGLITFAKGGTVEITIAQGMERYKGSVRNRLRTGSFGRHAGSFYFKAASPELPPGDKVPR